MKVQDLLSDYLRENNHLSLQGIGVFETTPATSSEAQNTGDHIRFIPDKHAVLEEGLLDFLKTRTGKMKSLAQSDLESFISSGKQLLNIGKPFEVPGIGVIHKSSESVLQFQPGILVAEQLLTEHNKQLVESAEKSRQISPEYYGKKKKRFSNKAIAAIIILTLAVFIWLLFLRKPGDNQPVKETVVPAPESFQKPITQESPTSNNIDSINGFELTIITKKDSTNTFFQSLKNSGHPVRLDSTIASDWKIRYRLQKPLSDTLVAIDSLRKLLNIESIYYKTNQ